MASNVPDGKSNVLHPSNSSGSSPTLLLRSGGNSDANRDAEPAREDAYTSKHPSSDRQTPPSNLLDAVAMPKKAVAPEFPNLRRSDDAAANTTTMLTKTDIQPTLGANLAPKSGPLLSQSTIHVLDEQTDSDPEFRYSKPIGPPPRSSSSNTIATPVYPSTQAAFSTMQFANTNGHIAPPKEPKTSSRRVKNYTLDDGTIVSGKGLGRGRPGIKRGPRNPKYKLEDAMLTPDSTSLMVPQSASSIQQPPQASKKRKRVASDASAAVSVSSPVTSPSRESSPEYNPVTATKSGRVTSKPTALLVPATDGTSPAAKRPKIQPTHSTPNTLKTHPKIKRRVYRGREQLALCEHCLRGHGPVGNVIVFCDACNKCWHQRCHDPQIPPTTVMDTKAEWYCADCDRILHGKKQKKDKALTNKHPSVQVVEEGPTFAGPFIGGAGLSQTQKTAYLHSLTREKLIKLVLTASELAPALPMFQAAAPVLPAAKFTSSYTTPASATPVYHTAAGAAQAEGDEDEGYETYVDEQALLYPKPGHGIKLPPEKDDMHILLEGKNIRTFSHWVRGKTIGKEYSGSGDVGAGRAARSVA